MTGMTMVFEDSASISDWNACLSDGEEESLLEQSSTSQGGVDSFVEPRALSIQQDTFCCKSCCLGEGVVVCLTTTTVAALAILLVFIPYTRLLGMVLAWQDLRVRDQMFFFEACKATFFVAMASLKKMLFWTWKS